MPSKIATVGLEKAHAVTYLRKARQLCEAAGAELDSGWFDATLILSIHAGISAADAVCIGLGTRKNKDAHERAADLLERVGSHALEFKENANRLRTLLAIKNAIVPVPQPRCIRWSTRCTRVVVNSKLFDRSVT